MKPTEEQVQAIIADTANKLQSIIDDPCGGDYSDFECYEDELGHCYNSGSHSTEGEIEEICYDGLPGINSDDADIYILAKYDAYISFHDDYDPGDYWTPPSGGIEIDEVEITISSMEFEVSVYNSTTNEYEEIEFSPKLIEHIIDKVHERCGITSVA